MQKASTGTVPKEYSLGTPFWASLINLPIIVPSLVLCLHGAEGIGQRGIAHLPPRGREELPLEVLCVPETHMKGVRAVPWDEAAPEQGEEGSVT